jgi:hypothetical protein
MSGDSFAEQIRSAERLTREIDHTLSQAERETNAWPQAAERIRVHVQPALNALFKAVAADVLQLKRRQPGKRPSLFNQPLARIASLPAKARFHSQVIRFRLRILGKKMQYWFYRLLPYLIALLLLVLTFIFWEEITAFLSDLLALPPVP